MLEDPGSVAPGPRHGRATTSGARRALPKPMCNAPLPPPLPTGAAGGGHSAWRA